MDIPSYEVKALSRQPEIGGNELQEGVLFKRKNLLSFRRSVDQEQNP